MLYKWFEIYKVIAYISIVNQIFDDKNKNGSKKGTIYLT